MNEQEAKKIAAEIVAEYRASIGGGTSYDPVAAIAAAIIDAAHVVPVTVDRVVAYEQ